ncbi:division/cell wall cluster transcriptional repressor MraZ [Sphingomonas sp.]|jgi:MraZ protein|uniref:division/cell wall cluster transcriptional repressor MraZ n=1 Tax=Sphingomonas sp. TaxID=28214 RepID=UPI0035C8416C
MAVSRNGVLHAECEVGVSGRATYQGKGIGLVDEKGRVAIPNALRHTLAKNAPRPDGKDGGTVIIAPHPEFRCLIAYDPAYETEVLADVAEREKEALERSGKRDWSIAARASATEALPFDGSGRFVMPAFERRYARIEGAAFFHANFHTIMIWSPKVLLETEGFDPFLKEACEWACEEKGIVL